MHTIKIIRGLGPLDARSVGRDALLRWTLLLPVLIALPMRLIVPTALTRANRLLHIDLLPYIPVVLGPALLLITPSMVGLVIGFLLLDQRDDGTLTALRVTPLPLPSYLVYRLLVPMLIGVVMTLIAFPSAGLTAVGLSGLVIAALVAAPLGPIMALVLAAFGENKVQGFALMKATSVFLIAPLVAYAVPANWQLAFGILPTYWPTRLLWSLQTGDSSAWLYASVGMSYGALLVLVLFRRFLAQLSSHT